MEAMYADAYSMLPAAGLMTAPQHPGHNPVVAGNVASPSVSRRAASPRGERPGRPPVSSSRGEGRSRSRLQEKSQERSQEFSVPQAAAQASPRTWGGVEGRNGGPPNPAAFAKKNSRK